MNCVSNPLSNGKSPILVILPTKFCFSMQPQLCRNGERTGNGEFVSTQMSDGVIDNPCDFFEPAISASLAIVVGGE